ncbi:hypothetical protein E4P82_08160 [Candidatus Competibacter phosphatis]|uniref:B12-binding domain-containing protein n=1 Tax=Candidatus Competibacter phosphatis TaxID=221280 RepID=A0ABX1TKS4_9GAMM|nr:hypothetical protein [Candidatus Competibacter phosphatis]
MPLKDSFATQRQAPLSLLNAIRKVIGLCEVVLLDLACGVDAQRLDAVLWEYKPDLIGITTMTYNYASTIRLIETIKTRRPQAKIVVGGINIKHLGEEVFRTTLADYIVFWRWRRRLGGVHSQRAVCRWPSRNSLPQRQGDPYDPAREGYQRYPALHVQRDRQLSGYFLPASHPERMCLPVCVLLHVPKPHAIPVGRCYLSRTELPVPERNPQYLHLQRYVQPRFTLGEVFPAADPRGLRGTTSKSSSTCGLMPLTTNWSSC